MNASFKTILQIVAEILSSKLNRIPLNVAIKEIAKNYHMSEEDVAYICNEKHFLTKI